MRRLITITLGIQSLGVVATFLLTFAVARFAGPEVQGVFATYKSLFDFEIALLVFGLPSGLVYYLNKQPEHKSYFFRWAFWFGLLLVPAILAINLAAVPSLVLNTGVFDQPLLPAIALTAAVAMMICYSLYRAIYLTLDDGSRFSWLSVLPPVLALVFILFAVSTGLVSIPVAYAAVGVCSLTAAVTMLKPRLAPSAGSVGTPIGWSIIRSQSAHVYAQSLLFGLQPVMTFYIMRKFGAGDAEIGQFNIAALTIAGPNLLVAMVAPVFFNRWSKSLAPRDLKDLVWRMALFSAGCQLASLLVIPAAPYIVPGVFGSGFTASIEPVVILLFAVFAVFLGRCLTPALQGLGRNDQVTVSCLARIIVLAMGVLVLIVSEQSDLIGWAAYSWLAGEYAALFILLGAAYRTWARAAVSASTQNHPR